MARTSDDRNLAQALTGIAAGDGEAMRRLYEATASELYAACFAVVRNREATEDVLQEVYTTVWNRAAGYDPEKGSPMAWLSFIARNSALTRIRVGGIGPMVSDDPLALLADDANPDADPDADPGDAPSERYRTCICSAYRRGLTYSQVAEAVGVPLGTARTRIRRGLAVLRTQVTRDRS